MDSFDDIVCGPQEEYDWLDVEGPGLDRVLVEMAVPWCGEAPPREGDDSASLIVDGFDFVSLHPDDLQLDAISVAGPDDTVAAGSGKRARDSSSDDDDGDRPPRRKTSTKAKAPLEDCPSMRQYLGFESMCERDYTEGEMYFYPEWKYMPQHAPMNGSLTEEVQRRRVREFLINICGDDNKPGQNSPLFDMLKQVYESGENPYMCDADFLERYNLRFKTKNRNSGRCHHNYYIFKNARVPYVTRSRPQILDYRIPRDSRHAPRQLRVNPVHLEVFGELLASAARDD